MGYLAFAETGGTAPHAPTGFVPAAVGSDPLAPAQPPMLLRPAPTPAEMPDAPAAEVRRTGADRFTALEWSIVALAERDRLASLRTPGRVATVMGALFGEGHNPRLADTRLEALRRMAVLSWHNGYAVPPAEVRGFLAAGFSPDQYQLLLDSISAGRARRQRRPLAA